jgi:glycosyltransferase involved in cell wall biosynthesis
MEPLVSIVVPIYNVEKYLDKCVQSLLEQSYVNLEIILVDDGSPDGCGAMCDGWAKKDRRISVIHKENGGLSDARNAGLNIATGEIIGFVDSDDWVGRDFVRILLQAMQTHDAPIAECAITLVKEDGTGIRRRGPAADEVVEKTEALRRLVMEDGVYQTVWNKLYRREVLEGILFEKGKCNEDDFWTYQVFDRSQRLALVAQPLLNYLQRGGSIMGTGYSMKRLDGVEARHRRMVYLQKYPSLASLTRQQFALESMWHLQKILRELPKEAQLEAKAFVLQRLKQTPAVRGKALTLNAKYRLWYAMFRIAPVLTARLRNTLGVGL